MWKVLLKISVQELAINMSTGASNREFSAKKNKYINNNDNNE